MSQNFIRSVVLQFEGGRSFAGGGSTDLTISFDIEMTTTQTPNPGMLQIMNPSQATIGYFNNREGSVVSLYAGYRDNMGLIYSGEIKQVLGGKDNAVDSHVKIFCGEHDRAYKSSRLSTTLAAGYKPQDGVNLALQSMLQYGITGLGLCNIDLSTPIYPRGRAFAGMARDTLRLYALSKGALWSMTGGKVHIVDTRKPVSNGGPIVLNSSTGLVSVPEQTTDGVKFRSLINPEIGLYKTVQIAQKDINQAQLDTQSLAGSGGLTGATNLALQQTGQLNADGNYTVIWLRCYGTTRGQEYYDEGAAIAPGATPNQGQLDAGVSLPIMNAR